MKGFDRCNLLDDKYIPRTSYHWMVTGALSFIIIRNCNSLPSQLTCGGQLEWQAAYRVLVRATLQFEIKIDWPPSWAAAGYTDLVLGFIERDEAVRWHEALSGLLTDLAGKGG